MLAHEPLLTLGQAATRYPGHRGARRLHPSALTRWILTGVRAIDGRRVKLEALRVGTRWLTSEEALQRFAEALAAPAGSAPTASQTAGRTEVPRG